MINLQKIKYKKCQPPPPRPLLRRPAPAPYLHHTSTVFFNFSDSHLSEGGNQNLLRPFKKNYAL